MKGINNSLTSENSKTPNWVVIGQGAIGLLWYSHLYNNSKTNDVYLLKYGNNRPHPSIKLTHCNDDSEDIPHQEVTVNNLITAENILICVKCYQLNQVIKNISPYLKKGVNIILCHNGMGALNDLAQTRLNEHKVFTLLTTHGSLKLSPTNIKHTGLGHSELGMFHGSIEDAEKAVLIKQLDSALPSTAWSENIKEKQWLKLVINCVINPITAIYDIENGEIANGQFKSLINDILSEVVEVARCEDINLDVNSLKNNVLQVVDNTAKNSSSMRCDVQEKRKTEIDHINGYIQKLGLLYQIKTPNNDKLVAQIQAL